MRRGAEQYLREISLKQEKKPDFSTYPFSIPAVKNLKTLQFHPKVTFLVGENGSGKSTLIEAIAVAYGFNPEGGTQNFNFSTRESHSGLSGCLRVTRGFQRAKDGFFLRAESYFNVATEVEKLGVAYAYGGISLHEQSHGESFLALLLNRLGGNGVYIFDEPEAALSPSRQLAFLGIIDNLVRKNSQFVIATHSPIIMAYPEATIYRLGEDGISTVEYEDTEHVQVTRGFLNNREQMLREILEQ